MNYDDYACFLVVDPENSNVPPAIAEWERQANESNDGRVALLKKYTPLGAEGVWAGSFVKGLLFKKGTPVPAGMRIDSKTKPGGGLYLAVPALKTPEGKAFSEEIKSIPNYPDSMTFSNLLGVGWVVRGRHLRMAWSDEKDGKRFVGIPYSVGMDGEEHGEPAVVPTGCEKVGWSVYFAAKEAEAQKTAGIQEEASLTT